ncbi:hypothetical protein VP06_08950 [Methylobacterium aquaticum]|uniref:Peptidase M28 domain-containing protein n=2 Tax=Methylobacterium aquaticum TaxID=270351 RepID=A0A0J6VCU7_9HYPH|nr:hypothetical protein VP06_08950 [Methylobacterium aquaticum]
MMRHLAVFAEREKLSGSSEERESFHYLAKVLTELGWRTELIGHDAYISLPGKARLFVGGTRLDCITQSFSQPSGPAGLRAPVVYAGSGGSRDLTGLDVAGRIVLLDGIANPAASLRASQAGALGQIHVSPLEHLYEMCISPVWGSPTEAQRDLLPRTVVVTIRHEDGDALKRRIIAGEMLEAEIFAEVETGWRETPILQADLDAPNAPDDTFVLFSGHHDTWYRGVMDNGSANATMLEVARLFAPRRDALVRGLRLCFWSGHSHGRYSGSAWYADERFGELEARCVAHVNVDSVGAKGNTVLTDALSSHELFRVAAEAVERQGGQTLIGHRMSRAGDQSFWGIGIPSLFMAMGEQPASKGPSVMGPAIGGAATRNGAGFGWWWHTPDDTLDKIDPDLLVRDARIYVHAIGRLLTDPLLPLDVARQVTALEKALVGLESDLAGRLDLSALLSALRGLAEVARRIQVAGSPETSCSNAALIDACRALVPLDYTRGDRFEPDPALKQDPYPVLDPIRALAATEPGTDASRFARVAARRALNRIAAALETARIALADPS